VKRIQNNGIQSNQRRHDKDRKRQEQTGMEGKHLGRRKERKKAMKKDKQ